MARLPPSRHPLHCRLRISDLRARDDSPLNRSCHQLVPAICLTRRLRTPGIRRCGLNATFPTRLQQCDGDWWLLSPRCYRGAHAARLGIDTKICDTVRLVGREGAWVALPHAEMCCSPVAFARIERRPFCEDPGAGHMVDLQAYAIGIFE